MSDGVLLAVLSAAALHAAWNALLRAGTDRLRAGIAVAVSAGALSLVVLPLVPAPALASAGNVAASVILHVAYFGLLGLTYRSAELHLGYPLMRGSAPLLAAVGAALALGEYPRAGQAVAIALLSLGVLSLALAGWRAGRLRPAAAGLALLNGLVIAAYTVVDGQGARLSQAPAGYTLWVFLGSGTMLALGVLTWDREGFGRHLRAHGLAAGLAGAASLLSYGVVLWAMTRAPIGVVAALRETSVLFAALLAAALLRERISAASAAAMVVVTAGAVLLRLS